MLEEHEFDGYAEVAEDEIESHKNYFVWEEIDGKILFPFKFIEVYGGRCYGLIRATGEKEDILPESQPLQEHQSS